MKKIVSLILALALILTSFVPVLASGDNEIDTIFRDGDVLGFETIPESDVFVIENDVELRDELRSGDTFDLIDFEVKIATAEEREKFIAKIEEEQRLLIEMASLRRAQYENMSRDGLYAAKIQEIEEQLREIEEGFSQMPYVVELSYENLIEMGFIQSENKNIAYSAIAPHSLPSVRPNTTNVNYRGIASTQAVSGITYHIWEVWATARNDRSPLSFEGRVNLLSAASYTQQQFNRTIELVGSGAIALVRKTPQGLIGSAIWSSLFASEAQQQRLTYDFLGTTTLVFRSVSFNSGSGFVHLQTVQQVNWRDFLVYDRLVNGRWEGWNSTRASRTADSENFNNPRSAALRFHNADHLYIGHSVGAISIRVHQTNGTWLERGRIPNQFWSNMWSIPN